MADGELFVNEVLFMVRNYFGRSPRTTICNILSGFYTNDEIADAKLILLTFAEKIEPKIDELRNIKTRTGQGKRKREVEDVIQIYTLLDVRKAILPTFVASNAQRIPTFKPEDVDACSIASNISQLQTQVNDIFSVVASFSSFKTQMEEIKDTIADVGKRVCDVTNEVQLNVDHSPKQQLVTEGHSLWSVVARKPPRQEVVQPIRRRIIGSCTGTVGNTSKLLVSSSKDTFWQVFIGKLDKSTQEGDVADHLSSNGIKVNKVSVLKPTKDWQENSAAFRVSVALESKEAIMDPTLWPANVSVRDWYFKTRLPGSNMQESRN
jgi:hypothetical protein